jgi:hypothetical protein
MSPEQMTQFRALRGIQGQTTGTRRVEEAVNRSDPAFSPSGLKEFLESEKAETTTLAFQVLSRIEQSLQVTVIAELKHEFGSEESDWWFNGVPIKVRKKIDDRINEEGGKKGGREENFDLIDYRDVIEANWELFEGLFARGKGRDKRTKWLVEINDLRKSVMHASKGTRLPISREQLAFLEEIEDWLETQLDVAREGAE